MMIPHCTQEHSLEEEHPYPGDRALLISNVLDNSLHRLSVLEQSDVVLVLLLIDLNHDLRSHRRPLELTGKTQRLVQPNHGTIVTDVVLQLVPIFSTLEPLQVAAQLLHKDTEAVLNVVVSSGS